MPCDFCFSRKVYTPYFLPKDHKKYKICELEIGHYLDCVETLHEVWRRMHLGLEQYTEEELYSVLYKNEQQEKKKG